MSLISAHGKEVSPELAYHRPSEAGYRKIILALFAVGVATFASLYTTQPLLGILSRHFKVPESHAAWSVSAATLLLGIGMVVAGPLSDRWGRTSLIKGSLAAATLLGIACAVAPSWPVLLVLRAAQGLALAGAPAVALVYLREEVHVSASARSTGLYIAGTAIGGMTGRLVTGGVSDLAGWRWGLAAVAALSGLCAIFVMVTLPASRHAQQSGPGGWHEMLSAFRRAVRSVRLARLYLVGCTSMGAFVAVYNVLGLRLTAAPYRLSVFEASLVFCVYPLGAVGSAVAGRLAGRLGRPAVVLLGGLFAVAGVVVSVASPLPVIVVGVAMITFGFFAAHGIASGWAASEGHQRGAASQASAFYLLAYYIGSSVFGVLGTSVWQSGRWTPVAIMVGVLLLIAAVVGGAQVRLGRRVGTPARG
jgi:MFS transporter, YNFM family, putative membrane transport protein